MAIARTNADAVHHVPGQVTEAARHREQRIVAALRQGAATAEEVIARTGLSHSATFADLRLLADEGVIVAETHYRLPRPGERR